MRKIEIMHVVGKLVHVYKPKKHESYFAVVKVRSVLPEHPYRVHGSKHLQHLQMYIYSNDINNYVFKQKSPRTVLCNKEKL